MSKIAVVYWSGTGNTQSMAEAVKAGAESSGASVDMYSPSEFSSSLVSEYDAIAFGCPAMGAEVLEETALSPTAHLQLTILRTAQLSEERSRNA